MVLSPSPPGTFLSCPLASSGPIPGLGGIGTIPPLPLSLIPNLTQTLTLTLTLTPLCTMLATLLLPQILPNCMLRTPTFSSTWRKQQFLVCCLALFWKTSMEQPLPRLVHQMEQHLEFLLILPNCMLRTPTLSYTWRKQQFLVCWLALFWKTSMEQPLPRLVHKMEQHLEFLLVMNQE